MQEPQGAEQILILWLPCLVHKGTVKVSWTIKPKQNLFQMCLPHFTLWTVVGISLTIFVVLLYETQKQSMTLSIMLSQRWAVQWNARQTKLVKLLSNLEFNCFAAPVVCRNLSWQCLRCRTSRKDLVLPARHHVLRKKTWWWINLQPSLFLLISSHRHPHLLQKVFSSRLRLACHPSSLSLSHLVQQTPSLHQGLLLFSVSSAQIFLLLNMYWNTDVGHSIAKHQLIDVFTAVVTQHYCDESGSSIFSFFFWALFKENM